MVIAGQGLRADSPNYFYAGSMMAMLGYIIHRGCKRANHIIERREQLARFKGEEIQPPLIRSWRPLIYGVAAYNVAEGISDMTYGIENVPKIFERLGQHQYSMTTGISMLALGVSIAFFASSSYFRSQELLPLKPKLSLRQALACYLRR